jgi:ribose/xylose/arabinose/galactoside ABC-type transport system permease subunit
VLAVFIIFSVTSSGFFTINNLISIVRQGSFLWMLATAATIVLLSEALDLSLGSVMTFSGVVAAFMLKAGYSAPLAVLGGLLVGVVSGAITGMMVSILKMPSFIASLGMLSVVGGLALAVTQANQVLVTDATFLFFGGGDFLGIPMPIYIALAVYVITYLMLNHTAFGRYIIAIGGNQAGARLSGLDVEKYRWLVFVFSGTVAAIAGVVLIGRLQTADPIVGMRWEFDAVAASILGGTSTKKGKGGITGTIIGVLLIVIMRNGLNIFSFPALNITGVPAVWQTFVVGSVILIAIVFDIVVRNRGNKS